MSGSGMDGMDIDFIKFSGLKELLSEDDYNSVWDEMNEYTLICDCINVDTEKDEEDGTPGQSDTYLEVYVSSYDKLLLLKEEIKNKLLNILKEK